MRGGSSEILLGVCGRSHINDNGGLEVYLTLLKRAPATSEKGSTNSLESREAPPRESLRVMKGAATGLLALLEDDYTKLEVSFQGCRMGCLMVCAGPAVLPTANVSLSLLC